MSSLGGEAITLDALVPDSACSLRLHLSFPGMKPLSDQFKHSADDAEH